jgi:hypothetical protein
MRPSPIRRHHPLAAAGTALGHFVLRHFGFQVIRGETNESPPQAAKDAGDAPQP